MPFARVFRNDPSTRNDRTIQLTGVDPWEKSSQIPCQVEAAREGARGGLVFSSNHHGPRSFTIAAIC
jgi:hypothetical protein